MRKRSLLLVGKDQLFRQLVSGLLLDIRDVVETYESSAIDLPDLLVEVADIHPDIMLLEDVSPLSADTCLVPVLIANADLPVIVVSSEHNWMHVVRRESVRLNSANELIEAVRFT